jgi:hypothetical protein
MAIAESLIGAALGGALRLAPEAIKFLDRERDRKHELAMQELALEFTKSEEYKAPEFPQAVPAGMDALLTSIRDQYRATGTRLDWVSVLVRPTTTYILLAIYAAVKLAPLCFGWPLAYGADDYGLLGGVLAFWFADRTLQKKG